MLRALLALLCAFTIASAQKKAQPKPPEIKLLELSARREAGNVIIDGRLRNTGERPVKGLVMFIDFRSTDKQVITTQRGGIDEEVLEPGAEAEFNVQVSDPVRAIDLRFNFEDGSGRYLKAINAGPFTIE